MDERVWSLLEQTGFLSLGELKEHFVTPWRVACAVDDMDDTILLIRQLRSGLLESEEKRKAKRVWNWLTDNVSFKKGAGKASCEVTAGGSLRLGVTGCFLSITSR